MGMFLAYDPRKGCQEVDDVDLLQLGLGTVDVRGILSRFINESAQTRNPVFFSHARHRQLDSSVESAQMLSLY